MFLQFAVSNDDSRYLRFFAKNFRADGIGVYEYRRHVIGAKSSPTCANYALHQVAKDNATDDEILVKAVRKNFYMEELLNPVRAPQ